MNYGPKTNCLPVCVSLCVCVWGCEVHFINSLKFIAQCADTQTDTHTHTMNIKTNNNLSYIISWCSQAEAATIPGTPSCRCVCVCATCVCGHLQLICHTYLIYFTNLTHSHLFSLIAHATKLCKVDMTLRSNLWPTWSHQHHTHAHIQHTRGSCTLMNIQIIKN